MVVLMPKKSMNRNANTSFLASFLAKHFILYGLLGLLSGALAWGALNWGMELTNTESFCISCHEMQANVYPEYKKTIHYTNRTGVRATCPDCHVPKQWQHKVIRKIKASNELFHWLRGSIDTPEKFRAKRYQLASHVWKSMRDTDSRECRNCHDNEHMATNKQTTRAEKIHSLGTSWQYTCINCHQGIAHSLPEEFDQEKIWDEIHLRMEQQDIPCHQCHEGLGMPDDDAW